jgi:transposase
LHSVRSLLVKQQTMLANAIRGLAAEFGLTAPKGIGKLGELMTLVDTDETIPEEARRAVKELQDQCDRLDNSIAAMEAQIVTHARHDESARRLATIPGMGWTAPTALTCHDAGRESRGKGAIHNEH